LRRPACRVWAACVLILALVDCRAAPTSRPAGRRLVILGFDGLDPDLVARYLEAGKLPAMARLVARGGLYRLETTLSPESPTAWASFATGVNPGKHNIFDFLVRDTATYLPDLGMVHREPPRFLFGYFPIRPPRVKSIRGGTSFWVTAGRAGIRTSVLTVPVTYPPEEVPNGELLSGLPLPDIRGTMGTFYYFATDLSRYEEGNTEFGGILKRLVFDGPIARTELVGPPNPIVRQQIRQLRAKQAPLSEADRARLAQLEAAEDVRLPLTIRWNRDAPNPRTATIEIQGHSIHLGEGQWSRWIDLEFRVNFFVRLHGMVQMLLLNATDELRLYVSPVNWHPARPPLPMSAPAAFARQLYQRLGPYRTLGWAEATWPLNEDRIDEQTFLDDLYRAFEDRATIILNRLEAGQWDLLVGVIESTDRVQHMMWRLIDPAHPLYDPGLAQRFGHAIEQVYRRADDLVGQVLARLDPETPVLIVSDHGFHSWRQAVNLNTWLVQAGYMGLKGQFGEKTLDDLFGGGTFWEHVDWSKTRAYAMGLGQIYLNLRGREAQGIVSPGAAAKQLAEEIKAKLLTLRDPETGARIVRSVYLRDEVYRGPYVDNAAELQVGMEDGYRVSWQTTLGGTPPGLLYPNARKWSGDHAGFDYRTIAGTLISSEPLAVDRPRLIDIAPTVLKYFGVPLPGDLDGVPLF
jgi:predicted AlkP superfamily phosphohydrolase/phosphomutase